MKRKIASNPITLFMVLVMLPGGTKSFTIEQTMHEIQINTEYFAIYFPPSTNTIPEETIKITNENIRIAIITDIT